MKHLLPILLFLFWSCEKRLDLKLEDTDPLPVIEGSIEVGQVPIVQLSWSQSFFDPINAQIAQDLRISNAQVSVVVDGQNFPLTEFCSSNIPDSIKQLIGNGLGWSAEDIANFDICIYTDPNFTLVGEVGKSYDLIVEVEGKAYTSTTTLRPPVSIDSLKYELYGSEDSLGYIKGIFSDPANDPNFYRVYMRRINLGTNGFVKDPFFVAPLGACFDDRFFDGLTFEFQAFRGSSPNSQNDEDQGIEAGLFRTGDTVIFKFCHLDRKAAEFIISLEEQAGSQGSIFASPSIIQSNIEGPPAFGGWVGYSPFFDTLYCYP